MSESQTSMVGECKHEETTFVRWPKTYMHVAELCCYCGVNVRGPSRWVPRSELANIGLVFELIPTREQFSAFFCEPNKDELVQPSLFTGGTNQ